MIRSALLLAAGLLLLLPAPARADDGLTATEKKAVDQEVHDYLIAHPEIIIEGLTAYQHGQDAAAVAAFKQQLPKYKSFLTSASTPFAGNPRGRHVVVEFFDYNCGYCKKAVDTVIDLIKTDPEAKVYFKDMPILTTSSTEAAKWALAAGKQGKYFEFHVALMHSTLPRRPDTYKQLGQQLGLDVAKMQNDAENDKGIQTAITEDLTAMRDLGIQGTPGFVIGDKLYDGYLTPENMKKTIADAYSGGGTAP